MPHVAHQLAIHIVFRHIDVWCFLRLHPVSSFGGDPVATQPISLTEIPMTDIKITKRVVDSAEPRATRYVIFDSEVKGFGLRVYPSGEKSWIFEYRPGAGGRRVAKSRITIGKVGDLTPDQARKAADGLRAMAMTGRDPQGDKSRERMAETVEDLALSSLSIMSGRSAGNGPRRTMRTSSNASCCQSWGR